MSKLAKVRIAEMTENRQLEKARKWCKTLTLAHFSVVLNVETQKAVILWYDGRVCKAVPDDYQAGATALLRNGETFTAVSVSQPQRSAQPYRAAHEYQPQPHKHVISSLYPKKSPCIPRLSIS